MAKEMDARGGGSEETADVLQQVFSRVGGLSGLLVVGFVAPVATGTVAGISRKLSLLAEVNSKAEARDEQDARRSRQSQELQLKLLQEISSKLDELKGFDKAAAKLVDAVEYLTKSLPPKSMV